MRLLYQAIQTSQVTQRQYTKDDTCNPSYSFSVVPGNPRKIQHKKMTQSRLQLKYTSV